jgi:iron complex transport system permease protein
MGQQSTAKQYRRFIHIFSISIILLLVLVFVSMNAGYTKIPIDDILRILFGGGTAKENLIIFEFRLPRIVTAILVGIGFSLSGCVLQGITKNSLADPGLMGINAGAGIVVVIFMTLYGTMTTGITLLMPFFSLLGALLTSAVIYWLSVQKGVGIQPMRLVLNGVAIQAGINACMTMIVLKLDDTQFDFVAVWQAGNIYNSNWKLVVSLLPWIIVGVSYLLLKAKELDILGVGDTLAIGLGARVASEKKKLLFTAVALAAAAVTISGSLHFVGLIGPHLARRLVGARHKFLLPVCAVVGALLVLIADTIGRTIIEPSEIPAGIVAAIIGAPYFILLMIRTNRTKGKRG